MNADQATTLLVLGAMGYDPSRRQVLPFVAVSVACHAFDELVAKAKARGFKRRKQLISAVRRGSGTAFALAVASEATSYLTPDEMPNQLAKAAWWVDALRGAA